MGRPIQKKWFGPASGSGRQIVVTGVKFADGTTASNAYIVKQTGSTAYIVRDAADAHDAEIVFMVNATSTSDLLPGQCYINATPYGGSARPCEKIAQFRVYIYEADGTVGTYSWSTIPAAAAGQADLISAANGEILSVVVNNAGYGYITAPTIGFTGGGSGATATASVANGIVTGITMTAQGSGYTSPGVTITAPLSAITATATVTVDSGAVTAVAVNNAGRTYFVAPTVTISGDGTGATATAQIANGVVTGYTVTAPGTGYTAATAVISAPPAAVQATATAISDN